MRELTEWVRFNKDGSSDHMQAIDGDLIKSFHMDPSPYVIVDPWPPVPAGKTCDWLVEVNRLDKGDDEVKE